VQLTLCLCLKTNQLLLCGEIIAVYFEIHTQIKTMFGQNVEFLKLNLVVDRGLGFKGLQFSPLDRDGREGLHNLL
jgi:hypothetical protein